MSARSRQAIAENTHTHKNGWRQFLGASHCHYLFVPAQNAFLQRFVLRF